MLIFLFHSAGAITVPPASATRAQLFVAIVVVVKFLETGSHIPRLTLNSQSS